MNDQIQLARRYVRKVWPHRWPALIVATVVCLVGWSTVLMLPNVYEVRARIFVDTQSMLRPLLQGLAVNNNALANTAALMQRTLLTRPNLEDVARKADLDLETKTDREFELLVNKMASKLRFTGTSRDNIYEIGFEDGDVQRAKRVVDELLNRFLETALGSTRVDTVVTQKFLEDQIAEYEQRLLSAEDRLKDFKQRNAGKMPGDGGSYFQSLEAMKLKLKEAELQLQEAQNRSSTLRRQLAGEEPVLGIMGDELAFDMPMTSQYDERIAKLEDQIEQLRLLYTDKHPDVIGLQEQIVRLNVRREKEFDERAQMAAQRSVSPGIIDPMQASSYQEINLAMAQADADVSALIARVAAYRRDVAELELEVDTVPEIEAELKRLDRDYGLNKQQYEELLKRREAARLAEEADQQADDIKLKVIEPPRIPLTPSGPNRVLLISAVTALALAMGAGFAVLVSQIYPRFYTTEEVREITHLPVLGSVSMLFDEVQKRERRMELAMFSLVLFGLFSFYAGVVSLEVMGMNLHARLAGLIGAVI